MTYVTMGAMSFIIAAIFDVASLKRIPYLKQIVGALTGLVFGCSLVMVALHPAKLELAPWLTHAGWPVVIVALFLLVYSLFLEIPFRRTYAADGAGDSLVTDGTYALVRHPGVLWLGMFLSGLLLVSRSILLVVATPIWLIMDVLLVWTQARFFMPRAFADYEEYRRVTPALIPTVGSIERCWRSFWEPRDSGAGSEE